MQAKTPQAGASGAASGDPAGHVGLDAAQKQAPADGKRPADHAVGSGPENEERGNQQDSANNSTEEKNGDGSDGQDALELEKQMQWKKEKRRKQNREAQRRRRDRLMNQQRQKLAEIEGPQAGAGQGAGNGSGSSGRPFLMMHNGDLMNGATNGQAGGKDEQFTAVGLNMAMRYASEMQMGGQMPNMTSNMAMKQLHFAHGGVPGSMQAWNYQAAMQGNMHNLHSFPVPQHAQLGVQHSQPAHQALAHQAGAIQYPALVRRDNSFTFSSNSAGLAMIPGHLGHEHMASFWDGQQLPANISAAAAGVPTTSSQLVKQASFGGCATVEGTRACRVRSCFSL